jgi:trigger factor
MTVNVREAGPFERVVGFELTDAEIDAATAGAARRLSQDLKLKGFRPGKAPRPVVEAAVGRDRLRSEAIEDVIPQRLTEVLRAEDLRPAVTPQLETMEDIEGGVSVEVKVTLWPTIEAPSYQNRTIEVDSPEVGEEEIEEQLERMREQFGQVEEVERAAGEGDFVSVDVKVEVDGEEVEDLAATELLYRIGSDGLLPGADDHLSGTSAGDVVTFDAPMPTSEDGEATGSFTVTVNEVKELVVPDLTDAWVDENTEFETVAELRETLAERMAQHKRSQVASQFRERALETLIDQVDVEIPNAIVQGEMEELLHRFAHRLEQQEISLEDYLEVTGISGEQFANDLEAQARQSLMTRLLLDAVAEAAGIEVSDEDVERLLRAAAGRTEDPAAFLAALRGTAQELSIRGDILRDKALEAIVENATPVDSDGNEVDIEVDEPQIPTGRPVMGEPVEGELVEGEVEGAVVEGEIVEAVTAEDESAVSEATQPPDREVADEPDEGRVPEEAVVPTASGAEADEEKQ